MHTPTAPPKRCPWRRSLPSKCSAKRSRVPARGRRVRGPALCGNRLARNPHSRRADFHVANAQELPPGEIGELIVRGPVVTSEYVARPEATAMAKISDDGNDANGDILNGNGQGCGFWHRMGDVGYIDEQDRFWFCGRMSQRLTTAAGPMYTIPCEAIFNRHPDVFRSALVGLGPRRKSAPGDRRRAARRPHPTPPKATSKTAQRTSATRANPLRKLSQFAILQSARHYPWTFATTSKSIAND